MPVPVPLRADASAINRNAMTSLVRAAIALGLGAINRVQYSDHVRRTWPDDKVAHWLARASVPPATIASNAALQGVTIAFLAQLQPVSAAASVLARSLKLEFDHNAIISVPSVAAPFCDFVAEGQPIPVQEAATAIAAQLLPFKIATMLPFTNEMLVNPAIEAIMRQSMIEATAPALDKLMFSNTAGTATVRPPGLLNGITPITATAGGGLTALAGDLEALVNAVAGVAGSGIVLVASVGQAAALQMLVPGSVPFPVFPTASLTKTVIALVPTAIVSATDSPAIEASPHALVQEQTTPSSDVMTGSPVRSYFQTDSTSLRLRLPATWAVRSPSAIAYVANTTW